MNGQPRDLEDEQLVRAVQDDPDGDHGRRAATELLGRWRGRVYGWCFRLVRDHDDALDLSQECLLSAYRALPGFQSRAKFSSWLFSIVRNRCLTALRPRMLSKDEVADLDQLMADARSPEDEVEQRDGLDRVLRTMLRVLDAKEQEAVWLRAVEQMPVEDITRVMKLEGASGARALLQTARRKLRAAVDREDTEGRPS